MPKPCSGRGASGALRLGRCRLPHEEVGEMGWRGRVRDRRRGQSTLEYILVLAAIMILGLEVGRAWQDPRAALKSFQALGPE